MNRTLLAIGAAIVGALAIVSYDKIVGTVATVDPCTGVENCLPVSVITVHRQPTIQSIPDLNISSKGDIHWIITPSSSTYTFLTDDDVAFPSNKPMDPAPKGEFDCKKKSNSELICTDNYKTPNKAMGYTITVHGSGSTSPSLDPYIVNN